MSLSTVWLYLADAIVFVHFAFVGFVLLGGTLLFRWRQIIWLHVPAVAWAACAAFTNWTCPLTYLEVWLRRMAHVRTYGSDFVEHYIFPFLHGALNTVHSQILLGTMVLVINMMIYGAWLHRRRALRSAR